MSVPKHGPVSFASFSVLAKNLGRSCAVPLYARDVLDKVIIFHQPLNATVAYRSRHAGRNEVNWRYCDYRGRFWFRFPKTGASKGSPGLKGVCPSFSFPAFKVLRAN
jgi:hypothetical protein